MIHFNSTCRKSKFIGLGVDDGDCYCYMPDLFVTLDLFQGYHREGLMFVFIYFAYSMLHSSELYF